MGPRFLRARGAAFRPRAASPMYCLLCHEKIPRLRAWRTKSEFCSDEHAALYKKQTLERLLSDANAPADRATAPPQPVPSAPLTAAPETPLPEPSLPAGSAAERLSGAPAPPANGAFDLAASAGPSAAASTGGGERQRNEGFDELWGLAEEIGNGNGTPGGGAAATKDRSAPDEVRRQTAEEALEALRRLAERAASSSPEPFAVLGPAGTGRAEEEVEDEGERLSDLPPLGGEFFDEERLLSEIGEGPNADDRDDAFGEALLERLASGIGTSAATPFGASAQRMDDEPSASAAAGGGGDLAEAPEPDWALLLDTSDLHALESSLASAAAEPEEAAELEAFAFAAFDEIEPPAPAGFGDDPFEAAPVEAGLDESDLSGDEPPAPAAGKVAVFPARPSGAPAEPEDSLEYATRELDEAPLAHLPAARPAPPNGLPAAGRPAAGRPAAGRPAAGRPAARYRPVEEFAEPGAFGTGPAAAAPPRDAAARTPCQAVLVWRDYDGLRPPAPVRPRLVRLAEAAELRFVLVDTAGDAAAPLVAPLPEPIPPRADWHAAAPEPAAAGGPLAELAPSSRGERLEPSLAAPRDERPAASSLAQPIYTNGELHVEPAVRGR